MLYEEIGRNIRVRRLKMRMTQEQLAEGAGISLSFMGHIERGTRKLSVDTLYKIAEVLGCSVDELMGVVINSETKQRLAREFLRYMMQMLDENA